MDVLNTTSASIWTRITEGNIARWTPLEDGNATQSWLHLEDGNTSSDWLPLSEEDISGLSDLSTTEPPYHVPRQAYFVMSGIIIHLGLVFNTLSLIVLTSSVMLRQTASGMYLIALSVADTIYLFGEFLRWINSGYEPFGVDVHFMDRSNLACKSIYVLRYWGKLTSAWLTVAITTERLLLVACPLKHARFSTPLQIRIKIALMFGICFLFVSFAWWSVDIQISNMSVYCGISNHKWYEIGNWVSLRVGSLLLPGLVVCIMTAVIIHYMTHAQKKRVRKLSSRRLQRQDTLEAKKMSVEKQLTIMLVAVAVAFLVLRLPYTITFYLNRFKTSIWPGGDKWFYYHIYAANKIADTVATLNYAINFFLYYICGNVFRKQLKLVCTCAAWGPRDRGSRPSISSSLRLTTMYSRSLSGNNRPESPTPSLTSDKNRIFVK